MNSIKYYSAAFSAFFLWGFLSLVLRPISYVDSFDILFFRILFSTVLIVFFTAFFKRNSIKKDILVLKNLPKRDKQKTYVLTVFGGLLLGINWFLFIYVINKINVQSGAFAYLICPIITTVFAFFILKERLKKFQWLAIAISFIGCVLYYFTSETEPIYAFIVAISYCFYIISQKKNVFFDKFNILLVQMVVISLISLPYYLINGFYFPAEWSFYGYVFILALVFTLIPLYLNLYALRGISASTVGVLLYINPIIALLLAIFYFKESINMLQIGSYLLNLFSILLFNKNVFKNQTIKK